MTTAINLDTARYEVFYNRMFHSVDDAKEVLRYLSGSHITREAGEVMVAFYLPTGEAVSIACGILMHLMNVTRMIRYMEENNYAEDIGIYDGDVFYNNDPYIGGMHVPDASLLSPVFYKKELVGYVAAITHTTETGAIDTAGSSPRATEFCHDGIHFPVVKIIERGKLKRDVYNVLVRAVRSPVGMQIDLSARIAAVERAKLGIKEVIDDFGVEFFEAATRQLADDAVKEARAKFKQFRPGIYRHRCYCDTAGTVVGDKLAIIEVQVEFTEEGELIVKVPVISPQARCFNNCYTPAVEATVYYTLLVHVLYDTRWNSGISQLVRLEVPDRSRLSADIGYSVAYCSVGMGGVFASTFINAINRGYYASGRKEEVAGAGPPMNNEHWGGVNQHGKNFASVLMHQCCASGGGGRVGKDGIPSCNEYNPWGFVPDLEGNEVSTPLVHLVHRRWPDSGGYGRWRGANSVISIELVHKSDDVRNYTLGIGGHIQVSGGLWGGYPPPAIHCDRFNNTNFYEVIKKGDFYPYELDEIAKHLKGQHESLVSPSGMPQDCTSGDILIYRSIAGEGLGDPIEREPNLIVEDIKEKEATLEQAQKVYCVAIDAKTLEVDQEKTRHLREAKRKERLTQGVPGREYVKHLVELREKRQLPNPVLAFLDETMNFSEGFRRELEAEEKFAQSKAEPLQKVKGTKVFLELTPYVNIVEDELGRKVAICSKCGFAYCEAIENYKLYCLIYDRDPHEIHPGIMTPDPEWTVYREFYCPGCGTQVDVEATPPGTPILHDVQLKKHE